MACTVCDWNPSKQNKIVKCSKCSVTVHQKCYGLRLRDTKFICDVCIPGEINEKQCVLCPATDGALKKTTNKKFVHVLCALYVKEVFFRNVIKMTQVDLSHIDKDRFDKDNCIYFDEKTGVCIKCDTFSCVNFLHTTCGRNAGGLKEIEVGDRTM